MNREWIHALPKVELHCHLDGSIPMATLKELAEAADLPKDWMEQAVAPALCLDLKDYLSTFDAVLPVLQSEANLTKAAYAVARAAHEENVVYLEMRFGPLLHQREGLSTRQVIEAVCKGVEQAMAEFPIFVTILACALRHHSEERNTELFEEVSKLQVEQVIGIDVAGDEGNFPNSCVEKAVKTGVDSKMLLTMHSGETGSYENVLTAIAFGAKRIGHGVAIKEDPESMAIVKEKNILLELCPTSNLQTGAVTGWKDYPLRAFMNYGIPVSINTDNRTVSDTTLTDEFLICANQFDLTKQEMKDLNKTAMQHAFASDKVKQEVINKIDFFGNE
ncbi:adenosine deaminase [Marinilactibacillus sp. 15R]|uniref:adenosine deaminase n=1 Tax=Marinilactibacillus sp. 15R TaxID=1911586 RepID=UPI0009094D5D|nr:adenosine deaminase [Marinilactibacillus sp. 15R]API88097.1 adenosine deaminase [Marinilactibacillus sp. 15R]